MNDLNKAIQVSRQAIKATPISHPDRASWLNNLGNHLGSRHLQTGQMDNLKEAIRVSRKAVEATPNNHPDLTTWLNNLGNKLEI